MADGPNQPTTCPTCGESRQVVRTRASWPEPPEPDPEHVYVCRHCLHALRRDTLTLRREPHCGHGTLLAVYGVHVRARLFTHGRRAA